MKMRSVSEIERMRETSSKNGLISEIAHQRGENGAVITNDYFYDNAGRLVDHNRYDGSIETNKYTERNQSYDRNGNILTLKRYGATTAAPQDNLSYTYTGNKLTQLNSYEYSYDANGNMTSDGRRNLSFTWNYLNLPATIVNNEGSSNDNPSRWLQMLTASARDLPIYRIYSI